MALSERPGSVFNAMGKVRAWADGTEMHDDGQGSFRPQASPVHAAVVALRVEPETGFAGAAALPGPVRIECEPGLAPLGDWSQMGVLENYSGGAWYRKRVSLSEYPAHGKIEIDLGKVVATAEVRVNGKVAGIRVAPPWRLDVTDYLRPGNNLIEILVFNTLANHYLTIPTRYRGDLASGLMGPVQLIIHSSPK